MRRFAGWLPTIMVGSACLGTLGYYGVGGRDLAVYAGYLLLGVVLPGTLLWRAARGAPGLLVTDVAAGTAVGFALDLMAYLPARAVGAPMAARAVPVAIITVFVAVPRLRRFWRGSGRRVPAWWAWLVGLLASFIIVWSAATFFRTHGLTWPGNASPYVDMPFHLALAGEAKHHLPPVIPYVEGQPLRYHWFVHAHLASSSWATGIELETLLYRLSPLAMLLSLVVLITAAGHEIVRRWWAGPLATTVAIFTAAPSPYRWAGAPVTSGEMLGTMWLSPTQTFGAMLFVPLVILLVGLLRERGGAFRPERWAVVALLLAALTGAKATFLPLLFAGLLVVLVGQWAFSRRVGRATLTAAGFAAIALLLAQIVLFRGATGGLAVSPLTTVKIQAIAARTGLTPVSDPPWSGSVLVALLLSLTCWAFIWAGLAGLVTRLGSLRDPAVMLCLGISGAGVGAAVSLSQPGQSQGYFFQSARPYLAILAVAGLAAVLPQRRPRLAALTILAASALAGASTILLIRYLGSTAAPTRSTAGGTPGLLAAIFAPYVLLVALAALAGIAVHRAGRRDPALRGLAWAAAIMFAMATAIPAATDQAGPVGFALTSGWRPPAAVRPEPHIDDGGVRAARWLRDNSAPHDLVATNVHCRVFVRGACENRHFWISAYTERRVLVEGWGYTIAAHDASARTGVPHAFVPFWNEELLADNDQAFQNPTAQGVRRLSDRYGVRWLFVDRRFNAPPASLAEVAVLRFRAGDSEIYEIVR